MAPAAQLATACACAHARHLAPFGSGSGKIKYMPTGAEVGFGGGRCGVRAVVLVLVQFLVQLLVLVLVLALVQLLALAQA